jgi:predicted nuclease of predicted toxin-antitoxin system
MLRLASDADVHGDILRGLRRRLPDIDLVRAQDALPEAASDPEVLAWAAAENRVLITNDRNTMIKFA